jgi:RNA polymerase sigma-70 factor (ECF subfamily)
MDRPEDELFQSDELLLDRWLHRDAAAFELLFERHYDRVFRAVYRLVASREEAEDVTQDTFLTLYTRPPRVTAPGGLVAWLRRVALNRGYNALRAGLRARRTLERSYTETESVDPQAEVLRAEECARVRRALAGLPQRQCALLLLRQEGLSYAEIAAAVGLAPGSVGALLSRAGRAFAKRYDGAPGSDREPSPRLRSLL